MIIELHTSPRVGHAIFVEVLGREAWLQWLPRGGTPDYAHPQGRRWGFVRDGVNVRLYAGRVYVATARTNGGRANCEYSVEQI